MVIWGRMGRDRLRESGLFEASGVGARKEYGMAWVCSATWKELLSLLQPLTTCHSASSFSLSPFHDYSTA